MTALRLSLLLAAIPAAAGDPAEAAKRAACLKSMTADKLLSAPADAELYDYAACSELVTGRAGLCDAFPGGPKSAAPAKFDNEVVGSDGKVKKETLYDVCVSRAAGYKALTLLAAGATDEELRPQVKLLLHGESEPVDEVLRTYAGAYRTQSLEGLARPDLARRGFFNHVLGPKACAKVTPPGLRRECFKKAMTLEAIKAKDAERCQEGDFLCRAAIQGAGVCKAIGDRVVSRFCGGRSELPPVKLKPKPKN
jgi:hypothetical protein